MGEDREQSLKVLKSQLVSCIILDGSNGVSERMLINRLKENWHLDIVEVYLKFQVCGMRELVSLFPDKFYMVNDVVYISLPNASEGVLEVADIINKTNKSLEDEQKMKERRYGTRRAFTRRPNLRSCIRPPPSRSDYFRSAAQLARSTCYSPVVAPLTPPPPSFRQFCKGPVTSANASSLPPAKFSGSPVSQKVDAQPPREVKVPEIEIKPMESVETVLHAQKKQPSSGFKSFILSHVTDARPKPGLLAHPASVSRPESLKSDVNRTLIPPSSKCTKFDDIDWSAIEEAFEKFIIAEEASV